MLIDNNIWTIQKILVWTASFFSKFNIESPRLSSELLLAYTLGIKRIDLYLQYNKPLNNKELKTYKELITRRANNEPVAYILQKKEFWSKDFFITKDVLIPRPETETIVEIAIKELKKNNNNTKNIIELGTGSGVIIVSLACEQENNEYYATDYSENAIKIAKINADKYGLKNKIQFIIGDWIKPFKFAPVFDLIISNPPYIPDADINNLQKEIVNYEPKIALEGGTDGLNSIKNIIQNAYHILKPGGKIICEIGFNQKEKITNIAKSTKKYTNIDCIKDYAGNYRFILLEKL